MTSRRKARRKFSQWVRYYAHYYGVQTYATPGMLRAYDAETAAWNRNERRRFLWLIERSSLGTPGARALRARADPEVVQRVLDRVREYEVAQLYRATLAYAEAEGGPEALDELTGFTAEERRQLKDRRHDGRDQELRVGQVLLREQQRAAHLLPVRPGCQTRDAQVQVRRTKEVGKTNETTGWNRLHGGDEYVIITGKGNSMTPLLTSGQEVGVRRLRAGDPLAKGDIVLARVRGRCYLHKVTAIDGHRVQIGNNHGHINGWTSRTNVVGKLHELRP